VPQLGKDPSAENAFAAPPTLLYASPRKEKQVLPHQLLSVPAKLPALLINI
jgi:hypothetical protein